MAKDRGVNGITKWVYHEQIAIDSSTDTIAHLRAGLKFGVPRKFSSKASRNSTESSQATSSLRGRSRSSIGRLTGLGTSVSSPLIAPSEQKRNQDEAPAPETSTIKKFKSNANFNHSIQEAEPDSLAGYQSNTYGNRIHCCLVVSPAGRPLHAYRLVGELLEALRDAIRGHKSLFKHRKILHRDISEKKILLLLKLQLREIQKGC